MAERESRFVEQGGVPGLDGEIRMDREVVFCKVQPSDRGRDVPVRIVEDQMLRALFQKSDRSAHPIDLPESGQAGGGIPPGRVNNRLCDSLEGRSGNPLPLLQGEDGVRREVLIHPHPVAQELDRGGGPQTPAVAVEAAGRTFGQLQAPVAALSVESGLQQFSVAQLAVGESPFLDPGAGHRVFKNAASLEGPFIFVPERQAVMGIASFPGICVCKETVAVPVTGRNHLPAPCGGHVRCHRSAAASADFTAPALEACG